jgi:AcrR family transcriptional regulator
MTDRPADTGAVPPPPWRTRARGRPAAAREPLSQEAIVEAALALVGREGLDALSMRRVAAELGTGPASLYVHVANKDELLELMLDRVVGLVELPRPDPARWTEQLREIAVAMFERLSEHQAVAGVGLAQVPTGANTLRLVECLLAVMTAGGVPIAEAAMFTDRLALYITSDVYEGSLYAARQRASGLDVPAYLEQTFGQVRTYLESLPADAFPIMSAHAAALVDPDSEERFRFGLDLLIDGVAARARPPAD